MTIDEFVNWNGAGECHLLQRLYAFFREYERDRSIYIDGLTLLDIERYGGTILYESRMTPENTLTFATSGGDDVHFGMLSNQGHFGDASPIVMTVPMADERPENVNFVVGETLHEFLCLGCVHGFSQLEEMAYDWKANLFELLRRKPDPLEDHSYDCFRTALGLSPWTSFEPRLGELARKYKPLLRFK